MNLGLLKFNPELLAPSDSWEKPWTDGATEDLTSHHVAPRTNEVNSESMGRPKIQVGASHALDE